MFSEDTVDPIDNKVAAVSRKTVNKKVSNSSGLKAFAEREKNKLANEGISLRMNTFYHHILYNRLY